MPGAEGLRHAPAVDGQDGRGDDHVGERDLAEQEEAGEDHPVLPEADDLARGDVDVARVVALELRRLLGPAERRERPERRREPRVEHVGVARRARPSRTRRTRSGCGQAAVRWPSGHVQIGIWWPHQSWRETHQSGACSSDSIAKRCWLSGWKTDAPLLQRLDRRPRELVHRAPPLRRDERLDARVAALARADRVPVVLALLELVVLAEPVDDVPVGLFLRQPLESPRRSRARRAR